MPFETFFNLNSEKRDKIEKAIESEFGKNSFEKVSISNIIEKAEIPRGSFYQYFKDKEDAIKYVVSKYMEMETKYAVKTLKETNGDIFETFLKIFDYMYDKSYKGEKKYLYKNIMKELRKNNITVFSDNEKNHGEEILSLINTKPLAVNSKKDLMHILQILLSVTRGANMRASEVGVGKDIAKQELEEKFEILKKGMLKK